MLSDEEKKAIEILKDREYDFDELYCTFKQSFIKPYDKYIKLVLNLIEKLQKEIEELKKSKYIIDCKTNKITTLTNDFVSKDKIKAKIEEIENEDKKYKNYLKDGRENFTPEYVWARPVLQSLLEKE